MKLNYFLTMFLYLGLAVPGWALGPSTGGGGFVVSCPQTPVSPEKVELLDLYEGREKFRFSIAAATGDLTEDYLNAVDRTYARQGYPQLGKELKQESIANLIRFMRSTKFVERPDDLPQAHDVGRLPWIPSQCSVEQVAYFDDLASTIYIYRPIWQKMDSASQAALVDHELWGRQYRGKGDQTSEYARQTVAHIFATSGFLNLNDGLTDLNSAYSASPLNLSTTDEISTFFVQLNSMARLQFSEIAGRPLLAKTWADLPISSWIFGFGRSVSNPKIVGCILTNPGVDRKVTAKVQGSMAQDLEITVVEKTGEPVRLIVSRQGTVISDEGVTITPASNCQ